MIIQMKRIALIAHKADQEAILAALQDTSAVQLVEPDSEGDYEDQRLSLAQSNVNKLGATLKTVRPYVEKKGFFTPTPEAALSRELEEELGFPVVFAYPPEEQEMQIFRKDSGKEAEPLVGEAKAAAMRRLWELALEKVDATML